MREVLLSLNSQPDSERVLFPQCQAIVFHMYLQVFGNLGVEEAYLHIQRTKSEQH